MTERQRRSVHTSIRFRITAISTLLVAAVLTVTLLLVASWQRQSLNENLHDAIEQRSDDLTDLLAGGAVSVLVTSGGEDTVAQVVRDGRVLTASPSIRAPPSRSVSENVSPAVTAAPVAVSVLPPPFVAER